VAAITEHPRPARAGRLPDRGGIVASVVIAAAYLLVGWVRHRNQHSGAFDLGIFDQAAWQLSHGRWHVSLVERHILADHFSPVMLAFAPLYRIVATPLWLLGAQALAIGATVLPMRAVARHLGGSPGVVTALVAASAPLLAAGVFDFHPSTLATPFLAGVLLYGMRGRPIPAALCTVGVITCRADLGLVALAGALFLFSGRSRQVVVALGVVGVLAGAVFPELIDSKDTWGPYYGYIGDGPVAALLNPVGVLRALLRVEALATLFGWMLPVGLLVLFKPRWMAALLLAGLPILLSDWEGTTQPWFHYGAPLVPLAVGGAVAALVGLPAERGRTYGSVVAVGAAAALLLNSPLSPRAPDFVRIDHVLTTAPDPATRALLERIGPDESVSAPNRLVPQIAHREVIYTFPFPFVVPTEFFPAGTEPDRTYPEQPVDVVIAPAASADAEDLAGYREVARAGGLVLLRPSATRPEIGS
jgi:uncharacterized membrane protein